MKKAIIKLGYTCNNNCLFCHSKSKRKHKDLSIKQIKNKIILLKRKYPEIKMIIFSGGEPTIRKDLFDILKFANKLGYSLGLNTNGRMLQSKRFINRLISLDLRFIHFSLHGARAQTHDTITQSPGSFNQTVKAIKNFSGYKIEKKLNFVVNAKNLQEMKDTIRLLKHLNIKIKFSLIEPTGHKSLIPDLMLASKKAKEAVSYAQSIGVPAGLDGFPLCTIEGFEGCLDNLKSNKIKFISEAYENDFFLSDEGNKMKMDLCTNCLKYKECEGIYPEYIPSFLNFRKYKPKQSKYKFLG